ncbi:hypothetical protein FRC17_005836 [Serendipita sp. 399]|nr:hypothetical protein FRC17_005836 [Serendipita sp. 399]
MKLQTRTKKILFVAAVIGSLAVVGTVIGVVVVEVKKNRQSQASVNNNNSTSSSTSSLSHSGSSGPAPTSTGAADPIVTDFPLDPALHKSFWGMAYTPAGAIMPECGANITAVRNDVQRLSQLTTRLRLYGSDCNTTSLVLQAISDLKVDLKVFAAIYLEPEEESYTRQKTILENALATYGTANVLGIAVGNEYVFEALNDGDTSANATSRVIEKMNEVRTDLTALGYNLQVGTSDTGGTLSQTLVDAADFVFANIHPWFGGSTVEGATTSADAQFVNAQAYITASTRTPPPVLYQGEIGWPSGSDTTGEVNGSGSAASVANLQTMLDNWVCHANTAGTRYFWFAPFDEPWKATSGLGVEPYWGLFDASGSLKDITIPTCIAP